MRLFSLIICAFICTIATSSCQKHDDEPQWNIGPFDDDKEETIVDLIPEKKPIQLNEEQKSFVDACNDFTFNLFRQSNDVSKSRILSPMSVAYVLGMLNDGAEGETSVQIMDALGFHGADKNAVNEFCRKLIEEAPEVDPNVKLNIANALFVNQGIHLLEPFKKDMKDYYHATAETLNFSSPDAAGTINLWCSKQTDGMINKILDETDPDELLYILNAIYFKATWTDRFNPDNAKTTAFEREDGSIITKEMMNQTVRAMLFAPGTQPHEEGEQQSPDYKYGALCLPYSSGAFCMYILLPYEGTTTAEVINGLTADSFRKMKEQMRSRQVDVRIPRFTTKFDFNLIPQLRQLGITDAFTCNAEFPGITSQSIYVSMMKQSAAIEVNEEGTKAAAVTIAGAKTTSAGEETTVPFWTIRPFVYVIQETTSGAIFFVGTYMGD